MRTSETTKYVWLVKTGGSGLTGGVDDAERIAEELVGLGLTGPHAEALMLFAEVIAEKHGKASWSLVDDYSVEWTVFMTRYP